MMDPDRWPLLYIICRMFHPPDAETRSIVHWTMGISLIFWANVATIIWTPRPLIVWNSSESAPIGAYSVSSAGNVKRGDMVAARMPLPWRGVAGVRGYIPVNVPLIKRVAGVRGDRLCASGEELLVNGRLAAVRRARDGQGRAMPLWQGCRTLRHGEYLLLTDAPTSFDGRYFGASAKSDLIGKVRPLWVR